MTCRRRSQPEMTFHLAAALGEVLVLALRGAELQDGALTFPEILLSPESRPGKTHDLH